MCASVSIGVRCVCISVDRCALFVHQCRYVCFVCASVSIGVLWVCISVDRCALGVHQCR